MVEPHEIKDLAHRYVQACDSVYTTAVANNDIGLAGLIARSALSVVLNSATEIGQPIAQSFAVKWFERLASLYKGGTAPPDDVNRTLKWASTVMIGVLNTGAGPPSEKSNP
jgi:hypothetical protein